MTKITIPLAGFKAAIFDMDGTMINNMEHHKQAWQEFLKRHGIMLTAEEFKQKAAGKKNDQILETLFGRKFDKQSQLQYADEKEAIYRELFAPDIKEIAGLSRLIETLHMNGIKTAIATTAPAKNRDFALKELELEGKFEVILGDEHVTNGKPHPEIYWATAKELGVEPAECLVFEDSPPGVTAGASAGMTVVGILSSHTAGDLQGASYTTTDFTDISFV